MEVDLQASEDVKPYSGMNMLLNDGGMKETVENEEMEEEEAEIRLRRDDDHQDTLQHTTIKHGGFNMAPTEAKREPNLQENVSSDQQQPVLMMPHNNESGFDGTAENDEGMPYFDLQEWARCFKSLRSICCIHKNADKVEKYFKTMDDTSATVEINRIKNWFIEVRNNLDKLTEDQMEDFMSLARKNWLHLESTDAKDNNVTSNSPTAMEQEAEESSNDDGSNQEDDKPPTPPSRPTQKLAGRRPAMKSAPSRGKGNSQVANKAVISREIKAALDEAWFKHLYLLFHYESLHGTINVPVNEVMMEDDVEYKVGEWLLTQRELLDYLRDNDFEKYDILVSLVTERGLWTTSDDNYKPRQHDFGQAETSRSSGSRNAPAVSSKAKPNNKRTVSKVVEDSDDNKPAPVRKSSVSKTADPKSATTRKVVATKSVPNSKPKAATTKGKAVSGGKKKKAFASDEESSPSEEEEESEESEEESEEEPVVAPKKAMTSGRITPRSTKSQAPPKPEPKTRKVRRTSSKKLSANETESEAESNRSGSEGSGSEAESAPRGKGGRAKGIRQDKQVIDSSSSQKDRKGLDHIADSKGVGKSSSESMAVLDSQAKSQPMPRTFGSSLPRETMASTSPQSVHPVEDSSSRSTRSRFNKTPPGPVGFPQSKRYDYAAFIYAVDDSKDVYLGIGMVTNQYVEDGCMTFNMQVLKSADPKKFLQSDFNLQASESATVRSQHIVVNEIKFLGDGIGGKLDIDTKNRILTVMKSAPNLRIET